MSAGAALVRGVGAALPVFGGFSSVSSGSETAGPGVATGALLGAATGGLLGATAGALLGAATGVLPGALRIGAAGVKPVSSESLGIALCPVVGDRAGAIAALSFTEADPLAEGPGLSAHANVPRTDAAASAIAFRFIVLSLHGRQFAQYTRPVAATLFPFAHSENARQGTPRSLADRAKQSGDGGDTELK